MGVYENKPAQFFTAVHTDDSASPRGRVYCAGYELGAWRVKPYAAHLMEWLPDYALAEEELTVNHANIYVRMQQAAARIYTSQKYKKRGEVGEITLHAICREYFGTIPISNRVFYKSASNDVVKAFDLVHARLPPDGEVEVWLGESKLYSDPGEAVGDAISSVKAHLAAGFLQNEKMLLGPQIPKATPRYDEIMKLFQSQTSLDALLSSAVFVVLIAANSNAAQAANSHTDKYIADVVVELNDQLDRIGAEFSKLRMLAVFVPLATKDALVDAFDAKLKGIQP